MSKSDPDTPLAPTTWHPADLFSSTPSSHRDFALIVLNQPLDLPAPVYHTLWANSVYHVAADGGANQVYDLNQRVLGDSLESTNADAYLDLDTVIGDFDSIKDELLDEYQRRNTELIRDDDQYSTDFTKAVKYAKDFTLPKDATHTPSKSPERLKKLQTLQASPNTMDLVALGGLGGRVDQGLSQLHHLFLFQRSRTYATGKIFLFSSSAITFVLKAGQHRIKLREEKHGVIGLGKHVGIVPMKGPAVISTRGLQWDVEDWETGFGGQMSTSNLVRAEWCEVRTSEDVLFTIDLLVDGVERC